MDVNGVGKSRSKILNLKHDKKNELLKILPDVMLFFLVEKGPAADATDALQP
jgi:hypothetical protein